MSSQPPPPSQFLWLTHSYEFHKTKRIYLYKAINRNSHAISLSAACPAGKKKNILAWRMIQCFFLYTNITSLWYKKPKPWDLKFHNFSYLSYQRGYSTLKNKCEFCIFPYELRPHTRTHNLGFHSYNRKLVAGNNIILSVYLLNVKTLRKNTKLFNAYIH